MVKRKKLVTHIPETLIARMEREAKRQGWDIDMVHEEAIIQYLESEKPMGKTKKK